jgi:hypothetical protein
VETSAETDGGELFGTGLFVPTPTDGCVLEVSGLVGVNDGVSDGSSVGLNNVIFEGDVDGEEDLLGARVWYLMFEGGVVGKVVVIPGGGTGIGLVAPSEIFIITFKKFSRYFCSFINVVSVSNTDNVATLVTKDKSSIPP